MIKGVLFDLDGVLVDTLHYHYLAWDKLFSERGAGVSEHTVLLHEGRNSREILPVLLEEAGVSVPEHEFEDFIEAKRSHYRSIVDVQFYPGALDVVRELRSRGYRLALVTACAQATMQKSLSAEHQALFELILTGDDVPRAKPNPDPYDTARRRLGLGREECVVVENAPLGIEAAKAAGLTCVAVTTTLGKEYLSEADFLIDRLEELLDLPCLKKAPLARPPRREERSLREPNWTRRRDVHQKRWANGNAMSSMSNDQAMEKWWEKYEVLEQFHSDWPLDDNGAISQSFLDFLDVVHRTWAQSDKTHYRTAANLKMRIRRQKVLRRLLSKGK